jgi:hypothetical protein
MTAITDILLTHHLTLHADDDTNDWHATCSCGADLGHCEDTWEGQKIKAAHVAHLIEDDHLKKIPEGTVHSVISGREGPKILIPVGDSRGGVTFRVFSPRLGDVVDTQVVSRGNIDHGDVWGLIEFLADPDPGVFIECTAGDSHMIRLTKTECRSVSEGVRDPDRRHGQAVESCQYLLKFERVFRGGQTVDDLPDLDRAPHDDSSTGDGPAATGSTDSVEVTARRGHDSDPGELGELAQAWRDVVTDYAAGRLQVTVSSTDADTHWCRLHRLMQAHTGEAGS